MLATESNNNLLGGFFQYFLWPMLYGAGMWMLNYLSQKRAAALKQIVKATDEKVDAVVIVQDKMEKLVNGARTEILKKVSAQADMIARLKPRDLEAKGQAGAERDALQSHLDEVAKLPTDTHIRDLPRDQNP